MRISGSVSGSLDVCSTRYMYAAGLCILTAYAGNSFYGATLTYSTSDDLVYAKISGNITLNISGSATAMVYKLL